VRSNLRSPVIIVEGGSELQSKLDMLHCDVNVSSKVVR